MKNTLAFAMITSLCTLASARPLLAETTLPLLSATVGSGSSESYLVLDFENATATTPDESYAFGYLYNQPVSGTQLSGFDMINALTNANIGFSSTYTYYPSFGEDAIDTFTYKGFSEGDFQTNSYWNYWLSPDGQHWTSSFVGVNERPLTNGSYDGWAFDLNGANPTPTTPLIASATPEPSEAELMALMALGLGGLLIKARRLRPAKRQ